MLKAPSKRLKGFMSEVGAQKVVLFWLPSSEKHRLKSQAAGQACPAGRGAASAPFAFARLLF